MEQRGGRPGGSERPVGRAGLRGAAGARGAPMAAGRAGGAGGAGARAWALPAAPAEPAGPGRGWPGGPEGGGEAAGLGEALFELDLGPAEEERGAPAAGSDSDGRMVCSICLEDIPLEDFASVSGCEHQYCTPCILQWAVHVEERRAAKGPRAAGPYAAAARGAGSAGALGGGGVPCPTCRLPFDELLTYRGLDGAFRDYLLPESIHLLTRAPWCRAARARQETGKAPAAPGVDFDAEPELEDYHLDEEEEEDYYDDACYHLEDKYAYQVRQTGAGKARVVVGNRRWGNGGYVSSGRLMARPRVRSSSGAGSSSSGGGGGGQGSRGKAGRGGKGKGAPLGGHVDSQLSLSCSPPALGSSPPLGASPPSCKHGFLGEHPPGGAPVTPPPGGAEVGRAPRQGRRAKRAAKRAAQKI